MLIYNFQKEFLGIDEKDLRALGFKDLAGLRTEVTDFSDLFVKTPGYIHNFKHVHWIDFITCADSSEESKVIINVNNKNYRCVINISTAYLVDNPSSKAYLVSLNNLRELSAKESESISGDITQRQAPDLSASATPIFNTSSTTTYEDDTTLEFEEELTQSNLTIDPYETPLEVDLDNSPEDFNIDVYDEPLNIEEPILQESTPAPIVEETQIEEEYLAPLSIEIEDDLMSDIVEEETPPAKKTVTQTVVETFDNGYVYDPTVASEELGLPLDLIEEFIQDFIEQAKEFKEALYTALNEDDLENVKTLSHKLKGVAANLRIEDALETLTVINTSEKLSVIEENLDTLYKIIAKLAGEEITTEKEIEIDIAPPTVDDTEEDEISLEFKEDDDDDLYSDPIEIEDIEVPLEIEIAPEDEIKIDTEEKIEIDMNDPFEEEISLVIDDEITEEVLEEPELDEQIEINYSKENTAAEIGLDIESFNELFEDYIQEVTTSSQVIHEAISRGDFQESKHEAMKLQGMSENMRVTIYAQEIETLINSSDTSETRQAIKQIDNLTAALSTTGV
ncbi:MAG: Hpt domain-containing protein [Campylobacterota bacterium]|nr:Hpt domain-containing protein [Campylobacterota bacterium]